MQIGFCGSGHFAALCLELISKSAKPAWVITNAPKPAGRGMQLRVTPVSEAAEKLGVTTYTTEKLSADAGLLEFIKSDTPDLIMVIDFGHMIKEPLLSLPRIGCINIHPSKLPLYRGSAPVQRAIMDGLTETAVTLFKLDAGMDSGPILSQPTVPILPEDDTESLLAKCAKAGCDEIIKYIEQHPAEEWSFMPQDTSAVSYAPKIEKNEGKIEWGRDAHTLINLIRALKYSPGTYCTISGKRLRIHDAEYVRAGGKRGTIIAMEDNMPIVACSDGAVKLISVQPEGKKIQKADEWLRGSRLKIGDVLE